MQLNGTLYKILSHDDTHVVVEMLDGHPVYKGHFPNQPITPGVMSLRMVKELCQMTTGYQIRYSHIKNCRFHSIIKPGDTLNITMKLTADESAMASYSVKVTICGEGLPEDIRLTLDATMIA